MALTARQQRFVDEYLVDLNAEQAARRAGYAATTARHEAGRLLANVGIQEALAAAMRDRSLRCQMQADEVLLSLARIARANMQDYAEWGPNGVTLKDSASMPAAAAACVAEVSQSVTQAGGRISFKLHDKVKALELLGKHLGLFLDRLKVEGQVSVEVAEVVCRTREEAQAALAAMAEAGRVPGLNGHGEGIRGGPGLGEESGGGL